MSTAKASASPDHEAPTGRRILWKNLSSPVLAPMIRDRRWAIAFASVAVVQILAGYIGFRTFDCPMSAGTGVPCPGCGLSRACGALLRGDWADWLALHVMAPFYLIGVVPLLISIVLPAPIRGRLIQWIDRIERRTCISFLILASTVVYWLMRLAYPVSN